VDTQGFKVGDHVAVVDRRDGAVVAEADVLDFQEDAVLSPRADRPGNRVYASLSTGYAVWVGCLRHSPKHDG
jgi:hypothetical protein